MIPTVDSGVTKGMNSPSVKQSSSCFHLKSKMKHQAAIVMLTIAVCQTAFAVVNAQTRVGALNLNPGESYLCCAVIDAANDFAYFGTDTVPGKVVKVRLSDFTRVGALTLNAGEDRLLSAVIDTVNGYAYFGTYYSVPGIVVKIRLSDFTRVGALTLNWEEHTLRSAVIDIANGFAYFGSENGVVKINLSTFTRVGKIPYSGALPSAAIDTSNGFAYFGTWTSPGTVWRVRLSDFSNAGGLTLNTDENALFSAVVDMANGFAYFGTDTSPGRIVKVRLSDFTRVAALTLNAAEDGLRSAVIDSANGFAYFGTETWPGKVVKVRLSDFTRVGALTLNTGEERLWSAVIDTGSGFAYFGTYTGTLTSGAIVVKVKISDLTRLNQVSGAVLNAPANTIYYVRTGNMYDDSALGFIYAKGVNPQNIIIQTDSTKVNQATGAPLFTGNMVLFGGRAASKVVKYYEDMGCALVTFSANATHYRFMKGLTSVYSVATSTYTPSKADYFVVQVYMEGSRTVFSMWGFEKEGTYASGIYFADTVYPNLATYTQCFYVCKWTDLNNDGIQQSNEISVVASGT